MTSTCGGVLRSRVVDVLMARQGNGLDLGLDHWRHCCPFRHPATTTATVVPGPNSGPPSPANSANSAFAS